VAGTHDHFWSKVLRGPTEGVGVFFNFWPLHPGDPEVRQQDVPISVQQDIFWLEVSVEDARFVEVAEGQRDLGGVELDDLLREPPFLGQVLIQLSARYEIHDKVDVEGFLEDILHLDYEGVVHLEQDHLLELQVEQRVVVDDDVLPDAFHRVQPLIPPVHHQVHLSEGAPPDDAEDLEVFQLDLDSAGALAVDGVGPVDAEDVILLVDRLAQSPILLLLLLHHVRVVL